jgi:hypothetical protein
MPSTDFQRKEESDMGSILWTVFSVLVVIWLLGFILHFGGSLIHLVLVVAAVVLVYNLVTTGRAKL